MHNVEIYANTQGLKSPFPVGVPLLYHTFAYQTHVGSQTETKILNDDFYHTRGGGYYANSSVLLFFKFSAVSKPILTIKITFIYDRCHRSWAVERPDKDGCDLKYLT